MILGACLVYLSPNGHNGSLGQGPGFFPETHSRRQGSPHSIFRFRRRQQANRGHITSVFSSSQAAGLRALYLGKRGGLFPFPIIPGRKARIKPGDQLPLEAVCSVLGWFGFQRLPKCTPLGASTGLVETPAAFCGYAFGRRAGGPTFWGWPPRRKMVHNKRQAPSVSGAVFSGLRRPAGVDPTPARFSGFVQKNRFSRPVR